MKEKIATSEWKIMEVLWETPNLLASQVIEGLMDLNWSDKTVKTLLNRLVKKELLGYKKEGKSYRYYPLVEKEACVEKESKDFIEKVFGGSSSAFLTNFIKHHNLSSDEIKELRDMLSEQEEDGE